MCLDRITPCLRRPPQRALRAVVRQRGFSVIAAIFLLVVLAALGAFMLTFSTVQQTTGTQDLQGARGYQAARSGVEWGAYQVLRNTGGAYATACRAGTTSQALPALSGTLAGFAVNVNCTATSYSEGTRTGVNPVWMYVITSTSTIGTLGQPSYVDRQIQISVAQ